MNSLNQSSRHALLTHSIQKEAASSAAELVDALTQLTVTTRNELTAINHTAVALRNELLRENTTEWLKACLMSAVRLLVPGMW